jgi:mannosyltransferase OCH1-like enzyme
MPDHLAAYGRTWEQHHPGWEHRLWTEANIPVLANQRVFDDAIRIAPDNVGQLRADIARYEILLADGGVYVDCDMECLRPLDDLLDGVECFAGWELEHRWVNNAILGAVPGHPFIADLVDGLAANVRRRRGARPNILTGPQYLTPIRHRHAGAVTVFPQVTFYPYGFRELDRQGEEFPDSWAVHHWANRRRRLETR